MSSNNRSVENARRFLWDSTPDSQGDAETGGANRRTNLSRGGGAGFSTRDFNVVDQSVNLMDLGTNTANSAQSKKQQPGKLSGLFRAKLESENLNKFTDEYGDADAMNQADAEEYIYKRRRRLPPLGQMCQRLNPKVLLTIAVALMAFVLVATSMGIFVEEEIDEKNRNKNTSDIDSPDNNNSSGETYVDPIQKRLATFKKLIIDGNVSPEEAFAVDGKGFGGSPQQQALDWIVLEDPAKLNADHAAVLDRYGLAVLYYSTNTDKQWKENTNWLSERGICSWHGIHCLPKEQIATAENKFAPTTTTYDQDNLVTAINLEENRLKGSIPDELGTAFASLQTINFQNNELTGTLPLAVTKLEHIKDLLLSSNQFTGTLPDKYAMMNNLHQLSLSDNQLEGSIPKDWETSLTKLRILAASHNRLKGSFPDLTKMIRLRELYLEENEFDGQLPESLEGMTSLLDLNIGSNKLSGPIGVLSALSNLETLDLSNNEFSGAIPEIFDQLFRLHELVLPNNKFEGSIPKTLTHLQTLKTLDLDSNLLVGTLPKGLGLMTDVTTISLRNNQFEGTIPTNLGRLDDIQTLLLNNNKLSGTIPTELGLCFRLKSLHLQNNMLTGNIPIELGELVGLSSFKMEVNSLEGATMPPQVCALRDDDLSILTSDCKKTKKVTCDCCTECH